MNFAKPILVCDENEEFRGLVREMLTKNGFFHIVEASSSEETKQLLNERKEYFVIIHPTLLNNEITNLLSANYPHFLILADSSHPDTVMLAAKLGVNHVLSFPFHSRKLVDKINSLI